ncbi:hypothetical protein BD289DRAFT_116747 [Coniella lustricola]|uniref:Uncharacterized protein n=1 Tax=Coniella lustricola TaxID=2025994 RepID=A0A2T2ZWW4_9PEZI|nr:hypothetical protein BD289DRAFT_116747 [Coniella lustricola]
MNAFLIGSDKARYKSFDPLGDNPATFLLAALPSFSPCPLPQTRLQPLFALHLPGHRASELIGSSSLCSPAGPGPGTWPLAPGMWHVALAATCNLHFFFALSLQKPVRMLVAGPLDHSPRAVQSETNGNVCPCLCTHLVLVSSSFALLFLFVLVSHSLRALHRPLPWGAVRPRLQAKGLAAVRYIDAAVETQVRLGQ